MAVSEKAGPAVFRDSALHVEGLRVRWKRRDKKNTSSTSELKASVFRRLVPLAGSAPLTSTAMRVTAAL
ncbi:hypothetical protein KUCAC02_018880 [Chaenocephalus aceratus]|uniref:Uncharacterized protein n=1 Tax=Chaenocephalus aceratus TaxID=36190 RepID=A0ACB9W9T7_CHAAC|nr:hypothetical protein KUCAC02_018880 [Chaenocephalus aceratus]